MIPRMSKYWKCRYREVDSVWGGMMISSTTQANQNFFKGNSNLAKPYPTSVHTAICSTAMLRETNKVFRNVFP